MEIISFNQNSNLEAKSSWEKCYVTYLFECKVSMMVGYHLELKCLGMIICVLMIVPWSLYLHLMIVMIVFVVKDIVGIMNW